MKAGLAIILIYVGLVVLAMPIMLASIPLGYAFSNAFTNVLGMKFYQF